ncbi:class I SAM-dependent methyltransferase [Candidatus Pelagibacter sp.]|jgi:hypothetical protein|nr:class I SAM-dependent methyltransferase [Candidatus Pelagibacter sp.]
MKKYLKKIIILISGAVKFIKKDSFVSPVKTTYDRFVEDEINDSYLHFKKHFYSSIFYENSYQIRDYAIRKSLINYEDGDLNLEFGFGIGKSLKIFSKVLNDKKIYAFGAPGSHLREDWVGHINHPSYEVADERVKQPTNVRNNAELIFGWVQDTLDPFLARFKDIKINFVHIDLDTYESTKYVLQKIKPYLKKNCIILFDELYNYSGWKVGEYKALTELFDEKEYRYLSFCSKYSQVVIQKL